MHSCKRNFVAAAAFALISFNCFSQNGGVKAPTAPVAPVAPVEPVTNIQMPQMPSISSQPTMPGYHTQGQKPQSTKSQTQNQTATTTTTTEKENQTATAKANPVLPATLNDLTAADLSALAKQGAFSSLSGLMGTNTTAFTGSKNPQDVVLTQILTELNEIKAAQKNLSVEAASKSRPTDEPPAIRRFVINNYDLLKACNAVYFSNPENDGSFLLTGDCKMLYNNQTLSETFYMFFKSNGTENGHQIFNVEISLSQSAAFPASILYKFCSQQNITAVKTGNLVTVKLNQNGINSDILLDVGK